MNGLVSWVYEWKYFEKWTKKSGFLPLKKIILGYEKLHIFYDDNISINLLDACSFLNLEKFYLQTGVITQILKRLCDEIIRFGEKFLKLKSYNKILKYKLDGDVFTDLQL